MLFGSKLNALTCSLAISMGIGASLLAAPSANAQRPNVIDCDPSQNTADNSGICSNGLGASFFFEFAENIFPEIFPNQFNYGSRGSSAGREGVILGRCDDDEQTPGGVQISDPCSFFASEAPLGADEIEEFYTVDVAAQPPVLNGAASGFLYPIQVPLVGGLVTISVSGAAGIDSSTELTARQVCALFNGTPDALDGLADEVPAALKNATGVHRRDGSGTSFIFTSALREQCNSFGPFDVNGDGNIAPGEDLWSYVIPGAGWFDRGAGADPGKETVAFDEEREATAPVVPEVRACGAEGAPDDTTCWPDEFFYGPGNDGVATVIEGDDPEPNFTNTGAAARTSNVDDVPAGAYFGYVDLATVQNGVNAVTGQPLALETPQIINKNDGVAYAATADNGTLALNSGDNTIFTTDNPNDPTDPVNQCGLSADRFDPPAGFPYVGVSYGLFFGDYTPTQAESGFPVAEAIFNRRGSILFNRYRQLFTNDAVAIRAAELGYVPINDVNIPDDLAAESLRVFTICAGFNN